MHALASRKIEKWEKCNALETLEGHCQKQSTAQTFVPAVAHATSHDKCIAYGKDEKTGYIDYVKGANIAGFKKVADALISFGII